METGVDSSVVMIFVDGSQMTVHEMTDLYVDDILVQGSRQNVSIAIKLGEVSAQVNPKKEYQTDFNVQTDRGGASVRGSIMRVFYDPKSVIEIVATLNDRSYFTPKRRTTITIPQGKEIAITSRGVTGLAAIGKAGARGGIDAERARTLLIALIAHAQPRCHLRATSALTIQPRPNGWTGAITVAGKTTGDAVWAITGGTAHPTTATARAITNGC